MKTRTPVSLKKQTVLLLAVLTYSGNPAVKAVFPVEPQFVCLGIVLGLMLVRHKYSLLSADFVSISTMYAIIALMQCIHFSFWPFVTITGFFVRLFIGYAVLRVIWDFPQLYVRAMVGLALLSFVFYVPYLLLSAAGLSVEDIITHAAELLGTASVSRRPLFLHTFMADFSIRNSGMFWEEGAFSGYLCLALVFLGIIRDRLVPDLYKRYFIILSIALLTTMSTTGYIAYPLILLLHFDLKSSDNRMMLKKVGLVVYVLVPCLLIGSWVAYHKIPFLKEKIDGQIFSVEMGNTGWHKTRMGTLLFDWEYIKKRPLLGWGLNDQTRFALNPECIEELQGMGNGMSDFCVKFGIPGMLVWLFFVFRSLMYLTRRVWFMTVISISVIVLCLQGECYLNYPLFLGLIFIGNQVPVYYGLLSSSLRIPSQPGYYSHEH